MVFNKFFIIELIFLLRNNIVFVFFLSYFIFNISLNYFIEINYYYIIFIVIFLFCYIYLYNILVRISIKLLIKINILFSIIFFFTKNIFLFYIFFELSVYPILILISIWGYQIERIQATSFFLGFTLFSRVPSIIIFILLKIREKSFILVFNYFFNRFLIFIMFIMFLTKLPIFIFHIWLPKAHVEAPTVGSILLAAILLKLGGWGLIKVLCLLNSNLIFLIVIFISILGCLITCLLCVLQTDIKALIAYSSVIHINFILLGLVLGNFIIKFNVFIILFFHAILRSIIFLKAGFIFYFFKTRMIYFSSISSNPQKLTIIILILILVLNFNLPPSLGFLPEIFLFISLIKFNNTFLLFLFFFGILSAFFCIFILIILRRGKNSYLKNVKINYFMKIINIWFIFLALNTLFLLLF